MTNYLNQQELAKLLRVNRTTIMRMEKRGEIKATKVGRAKRYDIEQLKK